MPASELIGYLAAFCTTLSFVPQACLTFRTRDVRGISLGMYSVFTVGVTLWLIYGLLLRAWPVVLANGVTITLATAILLMKLRYRRDGGAPPQPTGAARAARKTAAKMPSSAPAAPDNRAGRRAHQRARNLL